ncbi:hypothetical protein OAJ78_05435 [Gammaproteobacteria bacterium]|nr:hypothetical protein [Gammaproteobacteria bacterium]
MVNKPKPANESWAGDEKIKVKCPACKKKIRVSVSQSENIKCEYCAHSFPLKTKTFKVPSNKAILIVSGLIVLASIIIFFQWRIIPLGWLSALALWLAIAGWGRESSRKYYMRLNMGNWIAAGTFMLMSMASRFLLWIEFGNVGNAVVNAFMMVVFGVLFLVIGIPTVWHSYSKKSLQIRFANEIKSTKFDGAGKAEVSCPHCHGRLRLPTGQSGIVDCPHCRKSFEAKT